MMTKTVEHAEGTPFTALQGQYLAFIHFYTLIHRQPPAERDMQHFFRVTPPTIHSMVLALEAKGLIERTPGAARSIRVLVPPSGVPVLHEPTRTSDPAAQQGLAADEGRLVLGHTLLSAGLRRRRS